MAREANTYRAFQRNRVRGHRPPCPICHGRSNATCRHTRAARDQAAPRIETKRPWYERIKLAAAAPAATYWVKGQIAPTYARECARRLRAGSRA